MFSPFRAFPRHGGRRVAKAALTMGLLTTMASASLIVGGPVPAGAQITVVETLIVDKVQVGGPPDSDFFVDIDCPDDAFDASLAIHDTTVSSHDFPVGMTCTVTEQPAENFVPSPNPAVITVTMDADGETITFTNTFVPPPPLPDPGTLEVVKVLEPAGDPGLFIVRIDGDSVGGPLGDGGTTGPQPVAGDAIHQVSEAAEEGTNLADYDSSTACVNAADPATVVATSGAVFVPAGEDIVCTITNTRQAVQPPGDDDDDDDNYNQYPGDNDFDFDSPFDADDDPAPAAEVAGTNLTNNQTSAGGDPAVNAAGNNGSPAPASDVAPQAVAELPRTGTALAQLGLMAGLLMVMLGLAALLGARRRQVPQA